LTFAVYCVTEREKRSLRASGKALKVPFGHKEVPTERERKSRKPGLEFLSKY